MTALALALALFAQAPEVAASAEPPPAAEDRIPPGAPTADYPFVAWCYGALRGYARFDGLHDHFHRQKNIGCGVGRLVLGRHGCGRRARTGTGSWTCRWRARPMAGSGSGRRRGGSDRERGHYPRDV